MADNFDYWEGNQIKVTKAAASSGDPILVGAALTGVALTDTDADGKITLKRNGSAELEVEAVDANGASAIVLGDILYYSTGDDPLINKKATGVRFGYALEAVASGTDTIEVLLGV